MRVQTDAGVGWGECTAPRRHPSTTARRSTAPALALRDRPAPPRVRGRAAATTCAGTARRAPHWSARCSTRACGREGRFARRISAPTRAVRRPAGVAVGDATTCRELVAADRARRAGYRALQVQDRTRATTSTCCRRGARRARPGRHARGRRERQLRARRRAALSARSTRSTAVRRATVRARRDAATTRRSSRRCARRSASTRRSRASRRARCDRPARVPRS